MLFGLYDISTDVMLVYNNYALNDKSNTNANLSPSLNITLPITIPRTQNQYVCPFVDESINVIPHIVKYRGGGGGVGLYL